MAPPAPDRKHLPEIFRSWQKSSPDSFVMVIAPPSCWSRQFPPFSLNPSFFPPLPSARQQFIYIIVYAGSFLPPRRTHSEISCWCFLLFAGFFLVVAPFFRLSSPSPFRKTPPSLDFSAYFLLMHTYMFINTYATERYFASADSLSFSSWCVPLRRKARKGLGCSRFPQRFPERLPSAAGVAPSIGYLLFLTVCPHNKMAACCFYSDTGGGFEVRLH